MELNCGKVKLRLVDEDLPIYGDLSDHIPTPKQENINPIVELYYKQLMQKYEDKHEWLSKYNEQLRKRKNHYKQAYLEALKTINNLSNKVTEYQKQIEQLKKDCFVKLEKTDCIDQKRYIVNGIKKECHESVVSPPGTSRSVSPANSTFSTSTNQSSSSNRKRKNGECGKSLDNAKRRKKFIVKKDDFEIKSVQENYVDLDDVYWYLIRWKGFSPQDDSWELLDNLINCNYLLMKFYTKGKPEPSHRRMEELRNQIYNGDFKDVVVNQPPATSNSPEKQSKQIIPIQLLLEMKEFNFRLDDNITKLIIEFLKENDEELLKCDVEDLSWFQSHCEEQLSYILKCILAPKTPDPGMYKRAEYYTLLIKICQMRSEYFTKLNVWKEEMKALDPNVDVENLVDFSGKPSFTYITENIVRVTVNSMIENSLGCECEVCTCKSNCCNKKYREWFAYNNYGHLRISSGNAIYECGKNCKCGPGCVNRTVQNGSKCKLKIFRTDNGRGWGVKAAEKIKKGTFIAEYMGEIISTEEANVREEEYAKKGLKYIFDLDFNEHLNVTNCIDATQYGNIARFVNHSCSPNLAVFTMFSDVVDDSIYRLALFAIRDIKIGEEINFDYEMGVTYDCVNDGNECSDVEELELESNGTTTPKKNPVFRSQLTPEKRKSEKAIQCVCGAEKCRKTILFLES